LALFIPCDGCEFALVILVLVLIVLQKVLRERTVWEALEHPNILPFYGYADDTEFEPFGAFISPVGISRFTSNSAYYTGSGAPMVMLVASSNVTVLPYKSQSV